jgi:hypothetical protein
MIRYTGQTLGVLGIEKVVSIGLTPPDIDKIRRGEKITFRLEQHGLETGQCVIFFGESELKITQSLEKYMLPDTKIVLSGNNPRSSG